MKGFEGRKVQIIFRESVKFIPSTTFGTFGIYKYPAKFIPQAVAYVIKRYAKDKSKIFDPFAGCGTVGIVSRIYGCEYELWDLNPILEVIHNTAVMKPPEVNLRELIKEIRNSKEEFVPKWSNLNYWFPEEFISILSKAWGFVHSLENEIKYVLTVPLLKVTRYFSYSDEKIHKLYKSKYSKRKIKELLNKNWKEIFYRMLEKEIVTLLKKIEDYSMLRPKDVKCSVKAGVDTLEMDLDGEVNILLTSPPYLQAQEYIRSTKLELFWLGFDEDCIRKLSKKEIPYRDVKRMDVQSKKYEYYRGMINEEHLLRLYDRYFFAVLSSLTRLGENVTDYMCVFVGPAKIRRVPIPIDDIIVEHLSNFGWKHVVTYIDKIVSRSMFESNINPATGVEDYRMKTEHMVILKRR